MEFHDDNVLIIKEVYRLDCKGKTSIQKILKTYKNFHMLHGTYVWSEMLSLSIEYEN